MTPFRSIPADFPYDDIRAARVLTLILVKADGSSGFATDRDGKDAIVAALEPGDLLLMAWTGHYRTDIFKLTRRDLARYYRKQ
jgi:hypothetical protein